jgi:hypothetical protein
MKLYSIEQIRQALLHHNISDPEIHKIISFLEPIEIPRDNEIELEKQTSQKMQEKISQMYEAQIEQLNKKLENAMIQIKTYEKDMSSSLQYEINKVKEKYDLLLEEKDRQNKSNKDTFDKAMKLLDKTNNKSSISLGDSGEQIFENLSDTFKDFSDFKNAISTAISQTHLSYKEEMKSLLTLKFQTFEKTQVVTL